ncbi:MAG: cell envelope integrity protein CreD [Candidatus Delongbacteria bacterium]|nr:cell envelope integrity protein CreD [Candidatus Delongbacteria bacterium]
MSFTENENFTENSKSAKNENPDTQLRYDMSRTKIRYRTDQTIVKVFLIIILAVLLLIPGSFIKNMVHERTFTRFNAFNEVSGQWGKDQTVNGPVLYVPVEYERTVHKKVPVENPKEGEKDYKLVEDKETYIEYMHILPEKINVEGRLYPEIRYKSIYKFLLYRADLKVNGEFFLKADKEYTKSGKIIWEKAVMEVGFSDMKSINEIVKIRVSEDILLFDKGLNNNDFYDHGLSCEIDLKEKQGIQIPFSYDLNLNGSGDLHVTPIGKDTSVKLSSENPDPNFTGNFLPVKRKIEDSGFTAEWNVMHLNRDYPQVCLEEFPKNKLKASAFGVRIMIPVDDYRKISRAVKYLLMFVSLTFLVFFITEAVTKKKIHPMQYILAGMAIVVFFILLLSISEHMCFINAYLISSGATIIMIAMYSYTMLKSGKFTAVITSALTVLYTFLLILLQNQDYSLLFGSIGLFIALALTMYATRNVNWYNIKYSNENEKIQNEDN